MGDDAVYYDPYNWEIDNDPYPTFKRLRDEAPLYRNDEHGFWAVSRFADVEKGLLDWRTYRSGRGSVLEMIKAGVEIPPGSILFEDPPTHDIHRSLLARVFTPKRMNALEVDVRRFCADVLDEKRDAPGFDFVSDLGNYVPMRAIGMLMGVPEEDQQRLKDKFDEGFTMDNEDEIPDASYGGVSVLFDELTAYLDWRVNNPSDDLMTELLNAEAEELDGTKRKLSREEVLGYVGLLIGAGNETTTRLIGFTGRVLGENPEALREISADHSLVPQAIEEVLRLEPPSPVQARYINEDVEWYGQKIEEGEIMLFINGAANHDERKFEDPDAFNLHRKTDRHLTFGYGIHHCLGAALARLEGRIALEEVLKRFPSWEVDWDNVKQSHTTTVRGYHHMPVLTTKA